MECLENENVWLVVGLVGVVIIILIDIIISHNEGER